MTEFYRETIDQVRGDTPFSKLELALLAACKTGQDAFLPGLHALPEEDDTNPERKVRGPLIRYLLLGGCAKHRPHAKGVQLAGAWITDWLDLEGATAVCALYLNGCRFDMVPVFLDATLPFLGLPGCHTPGLNAHRVTVARSILLNHKFTTTGPVNLIGAKIGGALDCKDGQFVKGLEGNGMTVWGSLFMRDGFTAGGAVMLRGAKITGQIDCSNGQFAKGLNSDAMTVGADLFLQGGFIAGGPVILRRATINGQIDCSNGQFDEGLDGNAMIVGATLFLSDGFTAGGSVILRRAKITGQVACTNGQFDGGLNGETMTVGADMFLRGDKMRVEGTLNLTRAEIKGNLDINGGHLTGNILAENLTVGASLSFKNVDGKIGQVWLENAQLGKLDDDQGAWKKVKHYLVGGLRYGSLGPDMSLRDRLAWLHGNWTIPDKDSHGKYLPDFDPQPFTHYAGVQTQEGNRQAAAEVLYQREKRLRPMLRRRAAARTDGTWSAGWKSLVADIRYYFFEVPFGVLFGYGYLPMRAFFWTLSLWFAAVWLYGSAFDTHQMAPADPVVLVSEDWTEAVTLCDQTNADCAPLKHWLDNSTAAADHESFNRWIYGADAIIPLVSLGQETAWAPSRDRGHWGWWGFHLAWVFQAAGGIIAAFGAALLTGAVGRKD